jgi:hypothetical protein
MGSMSTASKNGYLVVVHRPLPAAQILKRRRYLVVVPRLWPKPEFCEIVCEIRPYFERSEMREIWPF